MRRPPCPLSFYFLVLSANERVTRKLVSKEPFYNAQRSNFALPIQIKSVSGKNVRSASHACLPDFLRTKFDYRYQKYLQKKHRHLIGIFFKEKYLGILYQHNKQGYVWVLKLSTFLRTLDRASLSAQPTYVVGLYGVHTLRTKHAAPT